MTVSPAILDKARAWQQVERHDARADGQFVYAVRSTGIYCRPSCPSRRPAQRNVVFYSGANEAEQAGYRPCKRCHPQAMHPQAAAVEAACRYLQQHQDTLPSLMEISRAAGMSASALQKLFRRILGISPRQYHAEQRRKQLRQNLADTGQHTVTEAIYAAGYSSSSRVYEQTTKLMGMTPAQYGRHGAGQHIRYTFGRSLLGTVLVAVTERGICAITLGESAAELETQLQQEFSRATLEHDDMKHDDMEHDTKSLAATLAAVLSQLSEHPLTTALPLDVRATAFQQRVWQALQQIPRGQTASYAQVAAAIGQPTAVRAVARACAQNSIAILIPCHRVLGSDGKLTGYRWGVQRKQKLLQIEAQTIPTPG